MVDTTNDFCTATAVLEEQYTAQQSCYYKSKSSNSSVGASICIPPFCAGASTVSGSYNNSKVLGDYASVSEQTGIQAGDGGFQLEVKGHTDLTGAVIASSELAIENNLNRLETGTLAARDIENYSKYKASAASVSGGYNFGAGAVNKEIDSKMTEDKKDIATLSGSGASQLKGSERSTTRSGISDGVIVITGLEAQRKRTGQAADDLLAILERDTRTGDGSGGLNKNWDGAKMAQQVQSNAQVMAAFSQQATHALSAYVQTKRDELLEQRRNEGNPDVQKEIQGQINELNTQERVVNVLIGALTGQLDTAAAHAVLQEAADQMRQHSIESSSRFAGVIIGTDEEGNYQVLNNISGESAGVRGDGVKIGGVRVDLDLICGRSNKRCVTLKDENNQDILDSHGIPVLELIDGMVVYDAGAAGMSFADFKQTEDGKKMSGLTGGIQGDIGSFVPITYGSAGFLERLVESFAGAHDTIGGSSIGLYDGQGNTTRGLTDAQKAIYNTWSAIAILPSTPFALSEALPFKAWQVLDVLFKGQ